MITGVPGRPGPRDPRHDFVVLGAPTRMHERAANRPPSPPIRGSNATLSEADSPFMAAEPHPSPRGGRPPVFSEEVLRRATGYSYARRVGTRRGAQDLVYRMFAVAVLEHYCEAYPEKAETLGWLLRPKRRHALLTELGRVAHPRSDAERQPDDGARRTCLDSWTPLSSWRKPSPRRNAEC